MNRFQESSLRNLKQELIDKEFPVYTFARIAVPEGTKEGDEWTTDFYRFVADQDRGEDGEAAVHVYLEPQLIALNNSMGGLK